ncbi:MAG: Glycerophosphoryl diester phosphodiesterase [Frankiales bacterium]|nr:Glycerophosphoryl diester phosphodiesterase [Frankiales bacterium]
MLRRLLVVATLLLGVVPAPGRALEPVCARPASWAPATGTSDPRGNLRVVGVQALQDVSHVVDAAAYRQWVDCLTAGLVAPHRHGTTLVVFNEDIGLMTVAAGPRGAPVREQAASAARAPVGDREPLSAAAALGELNAAYAPQVAAYQALLGPIDPRKQVFVAATDTMVRTFVATFSGLARREHLYVVASNNMTTWRHSTDALDVARYGEPGARDVYVATSARVTNSTFLWGPDGRLLFRNEKVPLTDLETTLLGLDSGPTTGPAAVANARGVVVAGHRLGFATSLPAFAWGYPFGRRPSGFRPCADLARTYAACMDAQGVDVMIQAEANPGRWAGTGSAGQWQPQEWLGSAYRAVADPTLHVRYAVNPFLVGNLLDLPFDGQSAITARSSRASGAYIGLPARPHFLALAPWTGRGSRAQLEQHAADLAPGSGSPSENHYLETAVYADLLP